ncbi:hypothetical protein K402DRAFT_391747 [Aulographum hederae CBS 113979]|uniref:Uncharacterized protein n=1 Tax=Aulographum hederae CBS 113979 TaxID=1176131 RepID=A0A6G1H5M7_9PEZI|nr:hypothetical protein K402DRAFT_391747 [Aulographum hederae CBS 113979]
MPDPTTPPQWYVTGVPQDVRDWVSSAREAERSIFVKDIGTLPSVGMGAAAAEETGSASSGAGESAETGGAVTAVGGGRGRRAWAVVGLVAVLGLAVTL